MTERPDAALTLVTVVFEAEVPLLLLQARSLARFVPEDQFDRVIVIDNSRRGLRTRDRRRLLGEYAQWRDKVEIVRPDDVTALPPARGWIDQQVLKLAVFERIPTSHYLVLDAKNVWVRPTAVTEFVNPDGRARGGMHGYREHPLRATLERVLAYFEIDPELWLDSFPVTHTPFVLSTQVVSELTGSIAARSGRTFAEEFVAAGFTEFFLYAAWIIAAHGDLESHIDGVVIRSSTVWPRRRSVDHVRRALEEIAEFDAPFLAVHRTALARMDRKAVAALTEFWVARGLFPSVRKATAFVLAYRGRYLATMSVRKARTLARSRQLWGRRRIAHGAKTDGGIADDVGGGAVARSR